MLIDQPGFVHQFISHCKHIRPDKPFNPASGLVLLPHGSKSKILSLGGGERKQRRSDAQEM